MSKQTGKTGIVCGVDEAGRGCLAGPVTAAAVVLPADFDVSVLNDSKKLTAKRREELFEMLQQSGALIAVSSSNAQVIDSINILQATFAAMKRAVTNLPMTPDIVLVDGDKEIPKLELNQRAIIGGDAEVPEIMAASIMAKVTRDAIMEGLAELYPVYGFERNKGYGTRQHVAALDEHGPCSYHRRSFDPLKTRLRQLELGL